MNIATNKNGNEISVKVEGPIDTSNYNEFETAVNEALSDDINLIYLDCSELNYISSSGLRIFLTLQKKMMASAGKLKLYSMQASIKEIFDISGFSSIFSIYPDLETAKQE